jgi:outer membrane autotransporter protein
MPLTSEPVHRWRSWAAGFSADEWVRGDATVGSADLARRSAGGAAGFDYQVGSDFLFGFAAGASSSTFAVGDLATRGQSDAGHIGAYGTGRFGPALYVAGTFNYSRFDNSTTRTITGIGATETATAKFNSDEIGGRLELGWKQSYAGYQITPFAALQFLELWQPGFTETSVTAAGTPGVLGLSFQSRTVSSLPTFLGMQFDTRMPVAGWGTWAPFARASWVHEFEPTRSITAAFIALPGAGTFTVDGPRAASNAARIEAGSNLYATEHLSVFGSFIGEFSNRSQSYAGTGGLRLSW